MKIRILIGTGMVMLTDLGAGITIASVMGKILGMDLIFYVLFIFAGMSFALSPDIKVFFLIRTKRELHHHRGMDHYPLIIIPWAIGFAGFIFILSIFWPAFARFPIFGAILVALCMLSHLIHDSFAKEEEGVGIQWLAPFSKKSYTIFSKKGKGEKRKPINSYTEEEAEARLSSEPNFKEWLEKDWLKLTPESASGLTIFIGAIILSLILYVL